jgi:hypothetical protein
MKLPMALGDSRVRRSEKAMTKPLSAKNTSTPSFPWVATRTIHADSHPAPSNQKRPPACGSTTASAANPRSPSTSIMRREDVLVSLAAPSPTGRAGAPESPGGGAAGVEAGDGEDMRGGNNRARLTHPRGPPPGEVSGLPGARP